MTITDEMRERVQEGVEGVNGPDCALLGNDCLALIEEVERLNAELEQAHNEINHLRSHLGLGPLTARDKEE